MKKFLLAAAVLLSMATVASATPLKLTDQQLDQTAAGATPGTNNGSGNGNHDGNGNGGAFGNGDLDGNLNGSVIIVNVNSNNSGHHHSGGQT